MKPSRNLVLIKIDPPKDKTASGLYIQEDWKSLPPFGTIVDIGPDVTTVKPGERVIFERYASIVLNKEERLCREDHLLGIVTDES